MTRRTITPLASIVARIVALIGYATTMGIVTAACTPSDSACARQAPPQCQIGERELWLRGCQDSWECPDGAACKQRSDAASDNWCFDNQECCDGGRFGGGAGEDSQQGACTGQGSNDGDQPSDADACLSRNCDHACVLAQSADANALIAGFDVSGRSLSYQRDNTTISWSEFPEETVRVRCAVFGCTPVVRPKDGGKRIINYDNCVIFDDDLPRDGVFDISTGAARNDDSWQTRLTGVWAGCWGYSSSALIAATLLRPIPLADIQPLAGVTMNCTDVGARDACPLDGSIGACCAGQCAQRCITPADCATAGSDDAESSWICDRGDDYVGSCRRVTQTTPCGATGD